jgi:hypothetical protein
MLQHENMPADNHHADNFSRWIAICEACFTEKSMISLSLGNYKGKAECDLKKIRIRPVVIRNRDMLNFTYVHKTRDVTKNMTTSEGLQTIREAFQNGFRCGTVFTPDADYSYEQAASGRDWFRQSAPTHRQAISHSHDRKKNRMLPPSPNGWQHALGLTDKDGHVLPSGQNKYRQIDRYVELLAPLLCDDMHHVVDMGAGKGYLTFALYAFMTGVRGYTPSMVGVERRQSLVDKANQIATDCGFDQLKFQRGDIADVDVSALDVLIALHACDTATDDAIATGIKHNAKLIVVAPCCHKQIRHEMDTAANRNHFMLKHGILLERQAEMVTDAIRALILESFGYRVKLFEFIASSHTPKNIMITALRGPTIPQAEREAKRNAVAQVKTEFNIRSHYLETCVYGPLTS